VGATAMSDSRQDTIRHATPGEAAAVAEIVQAAYAMYIPRMDQKPAPMLADYDARIAGGQVWVMAGPDRLRGVLVMWPEEGRLFLENLAVHPDDQGKGIGRQLLAYADDYARGLGLPAVELYTNEVMTENLAYYPRLGFVEVERRTEDGYRRVYMRKQLT
jgi:GNAT superfamily N-acetyltransferase